MAKTLADHGYRLPRRPAATASTSRGPHGGRRSRGRGQRSTLTDPEVPAVPRTRHHEHTPRASLPDHAAAAAYTDDATGRNDHERPARATYSRPTAASTTGRRSRPDRPSSPSVDPSGAGRAGPTSTPTRPSASTRTASTSPSSRSPGPGRVSPLEVATGQPETVEIRDGATAPGRGRDNPRGTFPAYKNETPWDAIQVAYFTSAATWNYLTSAVRVHLPRRPHRGDRPVDRGRGDLASAGGHLPRPASPTTTPTRSSTTTTTSISAGWTTSPT